MNILKLFLLSSTLIFMNCNETKTKLCKIEKFTELGAPNNIVKSGFSAPFVGILENHLIVAGGCNFPDKPLTEGGKKDYSNQIWALNLKNKNATWNLVGELPLPLAYGASVTTPNSLIFLGGNNNNTSTANVYSIKFNSSKDTILVENLTPLPFALDNFAAAYLNNKIYVVGGNKDGKPNNDFYCGELSASNINWKKLNEYIGACKIQPTLLAVNHNGEDVVYLSGGFLPGDNNTPPQIPTNILKYSLKSNAWSAETTLPLLPDKNLRSLIGASAVSYQNRYLIYFGGVNYNCFYEAVDRPRKIFLAEQDGDNELVESLKAEGAKYLHYPQEWYKFNSEVICYDIVTKQWSLLANSKLASRAGAGAAIIDNDMFIICGELKPGVRTPIISSLRLF